MIYYVEDDESIRDLLLYALRQSGFEAEGFPEAASFCAAMKIWVAMEVVVVLPWVPETHRALR